VNTDKKYNPIELSEEYLKKSTLDNQVSIEQGFNVELFEVSKNLAFIKNFGNIAVFKNGSRGLLIDTGMGVSSIQVVEKLKEWGISSIDYVIYTHGHVDHVTGTEYITNSFEGETNIIAHKNVTKRFDRYKKTTGYNGIINQRQFGLPSPVFPNDFIYPDITYSDEYEIEFNDSILTLTHGKGETDDATYIYSNKEDALFTGDFFIWSLPNAGNPSKAQRYVGFWGEVLKKMSEYNAEYLFPGHGPLIKGKKTIKEMLLDTSSCLLWIEENVLNLMNKGYTLREIQSEVVFPDKYLKPYLISTYDDFSFLINSVWRQYGGWYSGIPSELKPPKLEDIGRTYIDMAGNEESLLKFLESLVKSEKYKEASVIVDAASSVNSNFFSDIKKQIYLKLAEQEPSLMAKGIYNFNLDS
jgi:glyoxylase-like metal-dependent hydrolase (beta-lactamase superfamily II)